MSSLYFLCVCWNEDMNPSNTDRREMWMNAARGLVSTPEGNSRHLNSAPDATIILVGAEERGRGFLSSFSFIFSVSCISPIILINTTQGTTQREVEGVGR